MKNHNQINTGNFFNLVRAVWENAPAGGSEAVTGGREAQRAPEDDEAVLQARREEMANRRARVEEKINRVKIDPNLTSEQKQALTVKYENELDQIRLQSQDNLSAKRKKRNLAAVRNILGGAEG